MKRTDFGINANKNSILRKIISIYGSKEKGFLSIIDNFVIPNCSCCEKPLIDIGTIDFDEYDNIIWKKPRHIACLRDECCSSQIIKNSSEYRIKVIGRTEDFVRNSNKVRLQKGITTKQENGFFDDISNNPFSKEYWIKRGLSEDEALLKITLKNHNCPEYWIKRGLSEDEAQVLASQSARTNSLEEITKRHGPEKALLIYNQRKKKLSESWNISSVHYQKFGTSKTATLFFEELVSLLEPLDLYHHSAIFKNESQDIEWFFRSKDNAILFYDFAIPSLKLIIEYNGEHVHPNKSKLSIEEWISWRHAYSKQSADKVFEKDMIKITTAQDKGWNVLTVWSKEVKLDKTKEISKILDFITLLQEKTNEQNISY